MAAVAGVEHTVIESVDLEPEERGGELLIARVRPKAVSCRCSRCGRRCRGYDSSAAPRRWRGLDWGTTQVFLQVSSTRVRLRVLNAANARSFNVGFTDGRPFT
ncbi:MAG: transposase family protein [Pseudonocardiaceae bacterium]